jgi:hypothetical protein
VKILKDDTMDNQQETKKLKTKTKQTKKPKFRIKKILNTKKEFFH